MTARPLPPPRLPVPAWKRGLETMLLAAAGPVLGFVLHADDPFFAAGRFFWPLLGPLVAGLRYGAAHALGGAVLLLAGLAAVRGLDARTGELAAGTFALALVAGEFGDRWQRRIERLDQVTRADHLRTERLSRSLLALELSHERLVAARSPQVEPLAAALARLDECVRRGDDERVLHGEVLALLAGHAQVQLARLHPVDDDGRMRSATAFLGPDFEADASDPVVADALARRQVVAVDTGQDVGLGPVVAALPLVDSARRFIAVVVVHELPYEAMRPAALRELAVLCARIADVLAQDGGRTASEAREFRRVESPAEGGDEGRRVGRVGT